ncbi:hypothetical protein [Pontibacter anaerobius]|uniref:Lipocalin-like domain-containing protein n=1 Tax=Pontibacter anaerobius TaxID=2993940 RepID=A0ABT3RB85_9BACT|nr:hypothetical protein [Pontibacter anaerobius]MCX2738781.1 hypothetical protein [Pontibacter anaerobius]
MRTIYLTALMSFVLLFTSCKDNSVEPVDLTGDWQSEEIYVNGKLQENSNSTWLSLRKDNSFYRNYTLGTWSLQDGKLEIIFSADTGLQPLQYKVVNSSGNNLTLETTVTEKEHFWLWGNLDGDQTIIIEKYVKR